MGKITEVQCLSRHDTFKQVVGHDRLMPDATARFAMELIKIGSTAGYHEKRGDNETIRLLTPQEVVARCVEISEITFNTLKAKGMFLDVPSLDTLIESGPSYAGFVEPNK